MNSAAPDSPVKRLLAVVAGIFVVFAVAGLVYYYTVNASAPQMNQAAAMTIIHAAQTFTHDLRRDGKPVPTSIPLTNLVALHYLKPEDVDAFKGLDVTLALKATNGPSGVMMRVHFPDGGPDYVLLENGTPQPLSSPFDANP